MEWAFTQKRFAFVVQFVKIKSVFAVPYNGIVSLSVESSLPLFFIFKKTI